MENYLPIRLNAIGAAKRVVIKLGSRVLVQKTGRPNPARLRALVNDIAWLHKRGVEVAVVSSGAIGSGMESLGMTKRPDNLPDLQMAAAVGQSRLMSRYVKLFAAHRCKVGQVLLTYDDLTNRTRHLNVRHTMMNLLHNGIIPIINENDVVAVDEIKLGDNDVLASLVALLVNADLLILLTTTNGLYELDAQGNKERIPYLASVTNATLKLAKGKGSHLSTGGMATKLQAAQRVTQMGTPAIIADGRTTGILQQIWEGADLGTFINSRGDNGVGGRKRWIAFFNRVKGAVVVDDGAARALCNQGKSLLPIGITAVEGEFQLGAVINVLNRDGVAIARGLASYSSAQINLLKGRASTEIETILGHKDYEEIIHRDNLVILAKAE